MSYSLIAATNNTAFTPWKQWIHLARWLRWPPTSVRRNCFCLCSQLTSVMPVVIFLALRILDGGSYRAAKTRRNAHILVRWSEACSGNAIHVLEKVSALTSA